MDDNLLAKFLGTMTSKQIGFVLGRLEGFGLVVPPGNGVSGQVVWFFDYLERDVADLLNAQLSHYYPITYGEAQHLSLQIASNELATFMVEEGIGQRIPPFIAPPIEPEYLAGYISGIFDAQVRISDYKMALGLPRKKGRIAYELYDILEEMGLSIHLTYLNDDEVFSLYVRVNSLFTFSEEIGLIGENKRAALDEAAQKPRRSRKYKLSSVYERMPPRSEFGL